MSTITIYGFAGSTYVRTARMACVEKGLDAELEGFEFRSESHRALHPFLKMPAARFNRQAVFETLAILEALEDACGEPPLFPRRGAERIRNATWISAACDYLYPALTAGEIDPGAAATVVAPFDVALGEMPWLAGTAIGAADLFAAPIISYGRNSAPELLDDHANLGRWFAAVQARPSFRDTEAS